MSGYPKYQSAVVNFNAASGTLIAGIAGQRIRVHKVVLYIASAQALTLQDNATALTGAMTLSNLILPDDGEPWFVTGAGNPLKFTLGTAAQMSGRIYYQQG